MGAKFIIDRRCQVKTSLTLTGLIEAIKHKGLLRRVGELAAGGGLQGVAGDARLDMVLPPEPGLNGELTLRNVQEQAALLAQYRVTCRQCPSSMNGHVGGCMAYVPYPLSEGLEFLLWYTAVQALEGHLPDDLAPTALAFAQRARQVRATPFADGLRARGDMLAPKPHVWQRGHLLKRQRLTSAQVMDAFFHNGVLAGEELRVQAGFLEGALAVSRGFAASVRDPEQRLAIAEDTRPYGVVHELMLTALDQGLGVYVWP